MESYLATIMSIGQESAFPTNAIKFTDIDCIIQPTDEVGGLYLGNLKGANDIIELFRYKIDSVLTVAAGTNLEYDPDFIPNHLVIPARDTDDYDLAKSFDEGIGYIREKLKTGNVFVHCFAGVSRSATMVVAYLIQESKMELQEALKLVKSKRWVADPNEGFRKQLAEFEKKLNLKSSTDEVKATVAVGE